MSENKNYFELPIHTYMNEEQKHLKLRGIISRINSNNLKDSEFISEHIRHNYTRKCDHDYLKLYVINLVKKLASDYCNGYKFYDHKYYFHNDYLIKTKDLYSYTSEIKKIKLSPADIYTEFEECGGRMLKPLEIINMISNKKIFNRKEDYNFTNELKNIFEQNLKLKKLEKKIKKSLESALESFEYTFESLEPVLESLKSTLESFKQNNANHSFFNK